jgi:hypothetical protein
MIVLYRKTVILFGSHILIGRFVRFRFFRSEFIGITSKSFSENYHLWDIHEIEFLQVIGSASNNRLELTARAGG